MILHMLFLLLVMPFLDPVVLISRPLVVLVGLLGYTFPGLHMDSVMIEMRPRPHWPASMSCPWGSSLGIDILFSVKFTLMKVMVALNPGQKSG